MSHKASHWLADLPADSLNASAFRVLFHLCDAHNSKRDPETACFPSQEQLRVATGLSNGGLNNALNAIEAAGFFVRNRTRNADGTRGPTYYILGCDADLCGYPTPNNGDGSNSNPEAKPSPIQAPNHLHSSGVEPVIEPVNEPSRDRFSLVWEAWPESKRPENEAATEAIFNKLSLAHRDMAAMYAAKFVAMAERREESPLMIPYLKTKAFLEFDGAETEGGYFKCLPGSPEWAAWEKHISEQHHERGVEYMQQQGKWLTETRWPPKMEKAA